MKHLIASIVLIAPALAMAATPGTAAQNSAKATTPVKKTAAVKKTTPPSTARKVAGAGAAAAAASAAVLAPRALNADELALADRVHTGNIACELGQHVNVSKDAQNPGHFMVSGKGFNFHMSPVGTSTGVVRLEDQKAGAVWLQIANKSMLMNQKAGQRLADECMSPEQLQVAEAIKKSPPPSLLDAPSK
ncbi:hypothetical protein N5J23_02235 [Comamonas aquatica]|uniref:Uncharacterized protein n=1 Tax=Comamonas aquatica TaxID=225991 RepID=A0AA42W171_9BURK|nr:hypothetical protein [Comamonas aquatica]ANY61960.1 hypothetical protein MA05_07405 [Comamonas aquatica]MDH1427854.1 hypothetical protein [Comamonas aquatica]MDH1605841.1 hypothetical protein [Comamonas aquatica]MDH1616471.1 hypothetical protein [Comamonas aquatica]MDH2004379.1 hypothetical protein [Comamonas aquatica]